MEIIYLPSFVRQFSRLEKDLQEEVVEKIELFQKNPRNPQLKVHKLKGRLQDRYNFSVNYKTRVVFTYVSREEVALLAVGDHDVYRH